MSPTARMLRPAQLSTLLAATIPAALPVLIVGGPGVGKSDLVSQAAAAAGADILISHPAVSDPTDYRGLPWPDREQGQATFLPFGDFARALNATRPLVWFLDDIGQAPASVQAATMQLLLARRVNGHALPPCVTFIAATNRRQDRAGVSGILTPVLSRFASVVELAPDLNDWTEWAFAQQVHDGLIAFLRFRPDLLSQFDPSRAADMQPFPCPRTWARAGQLLSIGLTGPVLLAALAGAVGDGPAGELVSFMRLRDRMPSLDGILIDPDGAEIPSEPGVLYAVAAGLAARATSRNIRRIGQYLQRMHEAGLSEFGALCLRDAFRRDPAILKGPEAHGLIASPLARLVLGRD